MTKVAIVVSHPIQHFCPQYLSWSRLSGVELMVFFGSRSGLEPYEDQNFGRTVEWENLSLNFPHEFLPGAKSREVSSQMDCSALGERLQAFGPDVLIAYGYSQKLQRRALDWANAHEVPVGMIADSELRSQRSFWKLVAKEFLVRRFLSRVSFFLTVGDANEAYYRRYGVPDERLVRSFFPVDKDRIDVAIEQRKSLRSKLRRELSIPSNHKVILQVGKLVSWKRQRDLVKLANTISPHGGEMTLVLAGSGPDETLLKRLAVRKGPGGVIFAGFVPPTKLFEFYLAADIYVHSSEHEPHSLAISEAIYAGLPVVVSDKCGSYGPTDDVQVGRNGFTYQCGHVESLRDVINRLVFDSDLRARMGYESLRIARANQELAHGKALVHALSCLDLL